jgi:hypothetical protein
VIPWCCCLGARGGGGEGGKKGRVVIWLRIAKPNRDYPFWKKKEKSINKRLVLPYEDVFGKPEIVVGVVEVFPPCDYFWGTTEE